jgi:hypothetical protein
MKPKKPYKKLIKYPAEVIQPIIYNEVVKK